MLKNKSMINRLSRHGILDFLASSLVLILLSACSLSFTGDVSPPIIPSSPTEEVFSPDIATLTDQIQSQAENQSSVIPEAVENISVNGKVSMAGGGSIPEGLKADLKVFQMPSMQPDLLGSAEVNSNGTFSFEGISLYPKQVLIIMVNYNRAIFMSRMITAAGLTSGEVIDLPLEIHETTSDISVLVAERAHFYFDLAENDRLQILEFFIISNPSIFYVMPSQAGAALIDFILPDGAMNLQFEDQTQLDRFKITPTGFSDLGSIPPGRQLQILFAYELPFEPPIDRGRILQWFTATQKSLSIPIPVAVKSAMVMAPSKNLKLDNPQLVEAGRRNVQGISIQIYTTSNLQAGSDFELTVKSRYPTAMAGDLSGINTLVGFIVFILSMIIAIYWISRQPRMSNENTFEEKLLRSGDTQKALLDKIIALDDLYTSGKIAPEAYQERRAQLKEQLRRLPHERND